MKKNWKKIIFVIMVLVVIFVVFWNIFILKNDKFMESSITSCLTILVALIVSYFLSKKNQDEKNQKDTYLKLMEKMQSLVNEEYMCKINAECDVQRVIMKKRDLNNTIGLLKKYAAQFNLSEEISFIDDKVQEYASLIGNHVGEIEHLKKCELDLKRPLELIDNKLSEAMLKLYD